MHKVVIILGATGSGKTELGEKLALEFNGEIISADAKQVYRGMDIGTAKEKNLRVPQYLIDIKNPGEKVTVAEYQALAYDAIDNCITRGKLPLLVGGSMLYVEAVMNGYIFEESGKSTHQQPRYEVLKVGIEIDREALKAKVAARIKAHLKEGLLQEIRLLLGQGVSPEWLDGCGIEYRYFTKVVLGELTEEEAYTKAVTATNQYIKRQYTWWRRHADIQWVQEPEEARAVVSQFIAS